MAGMGYRASVMIGAALMVGCSAVSTPAEPINERLTSQNPTVRAAAINEVFARPESVDPYSYGLLAAALWQDGRRLQAGFWFYLFQIRTRPWAMAGRSGDSSALRGALNEVVGQPINAWLGGDVGMWKEVATRAMAYDARLPLNPGRPEGLDADAWTKLVTRSRDEYRRDYQKMLGNADPAEVAATRRENGLPSGPLADPGPPLLPGWR